MLVLRVPEVLPQSDSIVPILRVHVLPTAPRVRSVGDAVSSASESCPLHDGLG